MDTSNCTEQPKNQEYVARMKEVKEEDAEIRKWKLKHRQCRLLTLGLDQITKFRYRLDGPLGEGNV
jgi:nickel-dependent lactate racemase